MTKQEWRDKYKVELAPKFTPDDMADEKMTEIMTDVFVNTQADFFYSLHLQELSKIRLEVARLYCASGCSCCRDDKNWDKSAEVLASMLDIPKYEDGSGFDFYKVRDKGLLAITDEK